ncbi:glycoside hydrolase [Cubamyces lactineus]|nr:glycoside hydrolase [Cubamyces lactineus]
MAYYPDWAGDDFPPEKVDFARFDWIDFAFAVPDAQFNLSWDGSDDAPDLLKRLVSSAHSAGKHVKLSVGGWTGSRYFSSAAATAQGRTTLANNILALYNELGLDGIDIDWEYPAQNGAAGNTVLTGDSANFLAFLQLLRATLPPGAKITAATQTVPFAGPDGDPLGDVSAFAEVLDWVLLMNYDTWGSSSDPGPNAPLSDACNNSTQDSASALAALRAWTAAGFPASQLVLGVPSYGYISRSSASLLRTRALGTPRARFLWDARRGQGRRRRRTRRHRAARAPVLGWVSALVDKAKEKLLPPGKTATATRVVNEDGGTDDGQVQFRELVRQGIVLPYLDASQDENGSGQGPGPSPAQSEALRAAVENREPRALFAGSSGFTRGWDACSSTPFLRSAAAGQVVAYDDPVSLEMKAEFARAAGMRGVNMFDVHGDTDEWDLADALLRGLGVK